MSGLGGDETGNCGVVDVDLGLELLVYVESSFGAGGAEVAYDVVVDLDVHYPSLDYVPYGAKRDFAGISAGVGEV